MDLLVGGHAGKRVAAGGLQSLAVHGDGVHHVVVVGGDGVALAAQGGHSGGAGGADGAAPARGGGDGEGLEAQVVAGGHGVPGHGEEEVPVAVQQGVFRMLELLALGPVAHHVGAGGDGAGEGADGVVGTDVLQGQAPGCVPIHRIDHDGIARLGQVGQLAVCKAGVEDGGIAAVAGLGHVDGEVGPVGKGGHAAAGGYGNVAPGQLRRGEPPTADGRRARAAHGVHVRVAADGDLARAQGIAQVAALPAAADGRGVGAGNGGHFCAPGDGDVAAAAVLAAADGRAVVAALGVDHGVSGDEDGAAVGPVVGPAAGSPPAADGRARSVGLHGGVDRTARNGERRAGQYLDGARQGAGGGGVQAAAVQDEGSAVLQRDAAAAGGEGILPLQEDGHVGIRLYGNQVLPGGVRPHVYVVEHKGEAADAGLHRDVGGGHHAAVLLLYRQGFIRRDGELRSPILDQNSSVHTRRNRDITAVQIEMFDFIAGSSLPD